MSHLAALLIAAINGTSPNMSDLPSKDASQIEVTLTQSIRDDAKRGRNLDVVSQVAKLSASLPMAERVGVGCAQVHRNEGQTGGANDNQAYAEAKLRAISTIVNRRPDAAIERTVGGAERMQILGAGQGADVKNGADGRMERIVMEHSLTPIGAIVIVERLAITMAEQRFGCVLVEER